MHRSHAYYSTSYNRGIRWLPSPEVCRMMCVTDRPDMTFAVTVALNPSTTKQLNQCSFTRFNDQKFILSSANALNIKSKILSFGKELTHYRTMPHFEALQIYSCGKHCEKGDIAYNKQFLLFSQCTLPYFALIFHFKCTLKCRLQFVSICTSQNFVVW